MPPTSRPRPRSRTAACDARWHCSTAMRSSCATASWRCSSACPPSIPRALHALGDRLYGTDPATLAAFVDTVNAWLSARLTAGAADPARAFARWPRPGRRSTAPRATSKSSISSASPWFSTSSAGLPRHRAVDTYRGELRHAPVGFTRLAAFLSFPPSRFAPGRNDCAVEQRAAEPNRWLTSPATISPRPSPIPMARRISATPMRRSRPMRSPASCGSTATTCSSSPAPTSTASRCCRPRRRRSSPRSSWSSATCRASRRWWSGSTARTTNSSAPPRSATIARRSASGSGWKRPATSISTSIPAGTRCATKPTTTRTRPGSTSKASVSVRRARRSNGSRRRAISFGSPPTSRSCSISTRGTPTSCCRRSGSTRSRASSKAACRTSRSRARPSTGASRCRAMPGT